MPDGFTTAAVPGCFLFHGAPPASLLLFLQSAPPKVVFSSFQSDCAMRDLPWHSKEAQQLAVYIFLEHPASRRYPPRSSSLRWLLKHYMNLLEQWRMRTCVVESNRSSSGRSESKSDAEKEEEYEDGEEEEESSIDERLMEAYIEVSVNSDAATGGMCYKTFYNPYCCADNDGGDAGKKRRASSAADDNKLLLRRFCPIQVANGQFTNVGLSLWPAAFVLVQLLAQEFQGTTRLLTRWLFNDQTSWPLPPGAPPLVATEQLNMLELGAGVGLTPIFLHNMPLYKACVSSFVLTDYQPQLVANIKENLELNNVTLVEDCTAAARGLEGDKEKPFHMSEVMDWTHTTQNEAMLLDWGCDVVLAADCIYDVDVIPGLAKTIHLALATSSTWDMLNGNAAVSSGRRRRGGGGICVVVQTHRQDSTMKAFFNRVEQFAEVKSYTLVRGSCKRFREEMARRSSNSAAEEELHPLGEWPVEADDGRDTTVCALRRDTVLSDGSLMSARQSGTSPDPEELLEDAMIGPFYTSMVGLIGVHVLRLKKA